MSQSACGSTQAEIGLEPFSRGCNPDRLFLGLVRRLALIGVEETDADETRAQKAALALAAALVTVLAIIWVGTYWVLGLAAAAGYSPVSPQCALPADTRRRDFVGQASEGGGASGCRAGPDESGDHQVCRVR
jgi:hypothetical protein